MCDYYDIDQILQEDERVPCTFNTDAMNLGYLDPGHMDDDLEAGCKIALPLWMATTLAARNFVSVAAPNSFSDRVRSQLNADPGAVKLRDKNPYFYEVGLHLSVLLADGSLPAALRRVLASRFSDIFDSSTNSRNEDITLMMRDLTNLERELFEAGYNAANSLYRWKTRELTRLATAEVLKRGVKRGRGDR